MFGKIKINVLQHILLSKERVGGRQQQRRLNKLIEERERETVCFRECIKIVSSSC